MNLNKLNVTELRAYASDMGINLPPRLTDKGEISKFIEQKHTDPAHMEKLERRKKLRMM
jgi:hypothetical protein